MNLRVVEVEVGLVGVEAVPVVGVGDVIPGPVRGLEIFEDDPRVLVALVGLAPDVEVAHAASRLRTPCPLEPGCWSDVWLQTSSLMTRMPLRWASLTRLATSPRVP